MSVYDEVMSIAKFYLGPATERFLSRQVTVHLNVSPQALQRQHMGELAKWCFVSGSLVMGEAKAKELSTKIRALA